MMLMEIEMDAVCGGIILFLIGILIIFNGVQMYLIMRKVQNTPTSKIRSVAMGLAEIYGKGISIIENYSPFTNEKCVYYKIQVQAYVQRKNDDDDSSSWETILSKELNNIFKLQDDTGTINVDPKGADINLDVAKSKEGNITKKLLSLSGVNEEIVSFINKLNANEQSIINRYRNNKIKVTEWRITEGEKVYVLGSVEPSNSNEQERYTIKKGVEKMLFISNKEEKKLVSKLQMGVIFRLAGGLILSVIAMVLIFIKLNIF